MLGKKMGSVKKLAKKIKAKAKVNPQPSTREYLLRNTEDHSRSPLATGTGTKTATTPTGFFALYIGEERQRFVVPTGYLSHPLFRMLLEKSYDEFGFKQCNGLVVPCSIAAFQEVVAAVECCDHKFDFGNLVQEFI